MGKIKPNTLFKADNAVELHCGLKQCWIDDACLFLYFPDQDNHVGNVCTEKEVYNKKGGARGI